MTVGLDNYFFEDYLREANRAASTDELFSVLMGAVGRHGFNSALFALITDHDDIGQKADFGIVRSYSESWMDYYFEKGYGNIDPVTLSISTQSEIFCWDDLPRLMRMTKDQHVLLKQADDAGLRNGVAVPLRGVGNQLAALGFATAEKKDACDGDLDIISAYANHFYVAYKRLHRQEKQLATVVLTAKEREVLTWAASGKTDAEIAVILNLSRNTIDTHMRKIFKKLDANSRVLASVKAISMGLIHI
ncbi:helix-turn-helix transcriptional regulator [Micavibrio aeruginosavorus]|uniref:helix-turn-helix transcriptional regulator n=1 Tax=Micavibrio aeruginosavorus TaxID=349221 RepID=UPI003F4AADDC